MTNEEIRNKYDTQLFADIDRYFRVGVVEAIQNDTRKDERYFLLKAIKSFVGDVIFNLLVNKLNSLK